MLKAAFPPCIVLGLETQIGLGVVRELGRAGVPVIGIAQSADAIGLKSRYLSRRLVIDQPRSPALLDLIRRIGEETSECYLLAVSEVNLMWLMNHRAELGRVKPILPDPEAFAIALDKGRTLEAAEALGIEVPRTAEPDSLEAIGKLAAEFPFPAVLKWKDPAAVQAGLSARGLELIKAEYAYSPEDLRDIGQRYQALGAWPLVQSFCPGQGLGQFFFMHKGRALRAFQHIRVAEWPPEGGFSSVCDALPLERHADLRDKSIALLRAIGWEGMAMVEYRYDPRTGRAVLMEINGRFWGSFPLAVHCGAGFATLAYFVQGLGRVPDLPPLKTRLRCRMVATEIKRLWRILRHPGLIQDREFKPAPLREALRFFADFFKPWVRYYVWSLDDPGPFLADLKNLLGKRW